MRDESGIDSIERAAAVIGSATFGGFVGLLVFIVTVAVWRFFEALFPMTAFMRDSWQRDDPSPAPVYLLAGFVFLTAHVYLFGKLALDRQSGKRHE